MQYQFYRVQRAFTAAGAARVPGEAVQPDGWRNGRLLIEQRYIAVAPLVGEPVTCACGRHWVDAVQPHDPACKESRAAEKSLQAASGGKG